MIRWAELAAWLMRAAFLSVVLTTFIFIDFSQDKTKASILYKYIQNPIYNYIIVITLGSLLLNILYFDFNLLFPVKTKSVSDKNINNIKGKEYYIFSDVFSTLFFLLQGVRVKEVERDIIVLPGLKKLFLSNDCSYLRIENVKPIKKIEYFKTIVLIVFISLILILMPLIIITLNNYISELLHIINLPINFSKNIIIIFNFTIVYFYISSYTFKPFYWNYKSSSLSIFRKRLEDVYSNFPVYESFIMPYDYYTKIMYILSPIILPLTVFILIIRIDYLHFIGKLHFNFWLEFSLIVFGFSVINLIFILFIKLRQICEERADNFAVKKLGRDYVIKALQELAYGDDILPEKYQDKYRSSAIKKIERLKQK
ncbi:MAG: hypothetical protein QME35_10330 [Thermoanaerobacteraceae bacterium]|nr:hypothetical protein [Thermoanaerobacteraceae bacterium]